MNTHKNHNKIKPHNDSDHNSNNPIYEMTPLDKRLELFNDYWF